MDVYKNSEKNFFSPSKTSLHEHVDLESIDRPYLIVDLRDKDEFKTNHIISGSFIRYRLLKKNTIPYLAHHYPAAMLSRCSNNDSKELLIYVCFFASRNPIDILTMTMTFRGT